MDCPRLYPFSLRTCTGGCLRSTTARLRAKGVRNGSLSKKYRCDLQAQSDAPNPARGSDAPGSAPIRIAHMCSHGRGS